MAEYLSFSGFSDNRKNVRSISFLIGWTLLKLIVSGREEFSNENFDESLNVISLNNNKWGSSVELNKILFENLIDLNSNVLEICEKEKSISLKKEHW